MSYTMNYTRILHELGIMSDRPFRPEYGLESIRLKTFDLFPSACPIKPDILATAGFFFTGSEDCVRCFFCDVGLRRWEIGDDPYEEHARWYPGCNFLLTMKGDSFIRNIQRKYGGDTTVLGNSLRTFEIRSVIRTNPHETNEDLGIAPPNPIDGETENGSTVRAEVTAERMIEPDATEENQRLKAERSCKICLDNDACVVFLPCSHLCCCSMCVLALKDCPICRKFIRGTVHVFLS
jgi:baculoviral IAP repeat-containing protein 7/8